MSKVTDVEEEEVNLSKSREGGRKDAITISQIFVFHRSSIFFFSSWITCVSLQ